MNDIENEDSSFLSVRIKLSKPVLELYDFDKQWKPKFDEIFNQLKD